MLTVPNHAARLAVTLVAGSFFLSLSLTGVPLPAEEPAGAFLQALRNNLYHDLALEYLDRMESSPLASAEFKVTIPYERAVTLVEAAGRERDLDVREKQLDKAQQSLEAFLAQQAAHPLASQAKRQFGNLLVQRARMKIEQSKDGNTAALTAEAGQLFDSAKEVFTTSREEIKQRLEGMPKVPDPQTQKKEIELRDALRKEYLEAQLLVAAVAEEKAESAADGSEAQKKLLAEAATAYAEIYEKYRTRLAGLYARMYQARCNQKMGKLDDAISYYVNDLLEQPDSPDAFRVLKTKAMLLVMECWLDESQKKHTEAIARSTEWLNKIRPNEMRDDDWMELRLWLARAHKAYADELEKSKPNDRQIKSSQDEARKLAKFVARFPGALQQPAQTLLAELPGGVKVADSGRPDPQNFDEARTAGREALSEMQTAEFVLKNVPARIAREQDPQLRAELQKSVDDAQAKLAEAQDVARDMFERALKFADSEIPIDDLNLIRYFVCYLYFQEARYHDAVVMGEFIARRYPGSTSARQAAAIALAGYQMLYANQDAEDRAFETRRMTELAMYIAETWKGQPEAIDALSKLIPLVTRAGDIEAAMLYLEGIPADAPQRGLAELQTGQAIWSQYLRGMQEVREMERQAQAGGPEQATTLAAAQAQRKELEQLIPAAEKPLSDGVERMTQSGALSETLSRAMLSVAQLYVDTKRAAEAIELLEREEVGLLELIAKKHASVAWEGCAAETHRTALRAYVASLTKNGSEQENAALLAKASQQMELLQASVGDDAAGQQKLVRIYYSMARDLQQQIELLDDLQDKLRLSAAFETFLDQVRGEATELNLLNWVAEAFSSLGSAFETTSARDAAKKYYGKAAATYAAILSQAKARPKLLSDNARLTVSVRLANAHAQVGDYEKAMVIFRDVLKKENMKLNIQVAAAHAYQQWAEKGGQDKAFDQAIKGWYLDPKTRKNTIWGWIKIAQMTQRYEQFRDVFHEARYNLALCHYQYAKRQKSSADQRKYLDYARRDIENTARLYPKMGGAKWWGKYDSLLKQIQKELKIKVTGLETPVNVSSSDFTPGN